MEPTTGSPMIDTLVAFATALGIRGTIRSLKDGLLNRLLTKINSGRSDENLEAMVRRVVREEIRPVYVMTSTLHEAQENFGKIRKSTG
jgi:hypothetical protein